MEITIQPSKLSGSLRAISSKSQAHRILICAALSDSPCTVICPDTNQDIDATASCLRQLGADIQRTATGFQVTPIKVLPKTATLDCGESGSTLRFMLPVAGALGVNSAFLLHGRLGQRPLSPLWEEMNRMGCHLSKPNENTIRCQGKLISGNYQIDGGISSQFITGLLFALAIIPGRSNLHITGQLQSKPYVDITYEVLSKFGISANGETIHGCYPFRSPTALEVEGDWSNGAFFLVANALGNSIEISNLHESSVQGDREISALIPLLKENQTISVAQIPDLMPILSVLAAANHGATFTHIQRLRLKESDRVTAVSQMLNAMGIATRITDSEMIVYPGTFHKAVIDSFNDHRIAMAAAIAATIADGPITIQNPQCVAKSYPTFWEEYKRLGGQYE